MVQVPTTSCTASAADIHSPRATRALGRTCVSRIPSCPSRAQAATGKQRPFCIECHRTRQGGGCAEASPECARPRSRAALRCLARSDSGAERARKQDTAKRGCGAYTAEGWLCFLMTGPCGAVRCSSSRRNGAMSFWDYTRAPPRPATLPNHATQSVRLILLRAHRASNCHVAT